MKKDVKLKEKGIVAIGINFDKEKENPINVELSTSMTTETLEGDMGLIIGPSFEETVVIDDNGKGFRVVKTGKKIERVDEIEPEKLKSIIEERKKSGKPMEKPVPVEYIDAIKEHTGYEVSIDVSMIKDSKKKEDMDR